MLCRNLVKDFERWKSVFDSHLKAHREIGLRLVNLWRSMDEPKNVFFLFEVASLERAQKFISEPALKLEKCLVSLMAKFISLKMRSDTGSLRTPKSTSGSDEFGKHVKGII
jgi:hypothetical protein